VLDQRGQLLRSALGFVGLPRPSYDRALQALRSWLDSWAGIGQVAVGMHRQGYDLQLTQYDERGWRATFYTSGMEHSPTSATGTGWECTPWHATQRAAWEALDEGRERDVRYAGRASTSLVRHRNAAPRGESFSDPRAPSSPRPSGVRSEPTDYCILR